MPYYGLDKIIWNENQLQCLDETQVKNKDVVRKEDIEGYPCWGGGTENPGKQLTDEEIEASKPTLEEKLEPVMTTLQNFYDKCQKLDLTELPSDWSATIGNAKELGITPDQALELYVVWKENLQAYEENVREWWDKQ